jgi:hypothetical protein
MITSILQQLTNAVQDLLPKSEANTQADAVSQQNHRQQVETNQIPVSREVIQDLSNGTPKTPPAGTATPVTTMTPEEISNAKLATQEFNPKFLKEIAADLQPTLLKPTGDKEEQITKLTNLITDVLAGKNPAIPEFKHDKVLDFSNKEPAESFFERVIDRYHAEVTSKDNYPRDLGQEELTKLVKANLEPLVGLAVKLENANLTNQISNLFNRNLGITSGHNNLFFGGFMRNNNLEKAVSTASNDLFTQLATSKPELVLRGLFDSSSWTASALLGVSDEGFKAILGSLKSQPDSLVKALVNATSKEINPLVGYNDLTKGRQEKLSQILEAVKPLETKLTEGPAVAQFLADKTQVIDYFTKVVNQGSK